MKSLCMALALVLVCMTSHAQLSEQEMRKLYAELHWMQPGSKGLIANKAEFKTTDQFTFLNATDTDKFLKLNGNPPTGGNAYTIAPVKGEWFGILQFAEEGYVKDDEKIDASALLEQLKANNVSGNEVKRKEGYPTLTLMGWAMPPRYDKQSQRLEWGTRLITDADKVEVVNVSTRLLGRHGYMSATLVTTPSTMEADLADFKLALKNFDYISGEKYSEWREGDKVAAYGLGALVLGGAAAVATSKGALKAIGLALVAAAVAALGFFKKLLSRKTS